MAHEDTRCRCRIRRNLACNREPGDRTNNRIQVFTENGEFIEEWPDIYGPVNIYIDVDDWVWVISARLNRILNSSTTRMASSSSTGARTDKRRGRGRAACRVHIS